MDKKIYELTLSISTYGLEKLNEDLKRVLKQMQMLGMTFAPYVPEMKKFERRYLKARARSQGSNAARRSRKHGRPR